MLDQHALNPRVATYEVVVCILWKFARTNWLAGWELSGKAAAGVVDLRSCEWRSRIVRMIKRRKLLILK